MQGSRSLHPEQRKTTFPCQVRLAVDGTSSRLTSLNRAVQRQCQDPLHLEAHNCGTLSIASSTLQCRHSRWEAACTAHDSRGEEDPCYSSGEGEKGLC